MCSIIPRIESLGKTKELLKRAELCQVRSLGDSEAAIGKSSHTIHQSSGLKGAHKLAAIDWVIKRLSFRLSFMYKQTPRTAVFNRLSPHYMQMQSITSIHAPRYKGNNDESESECVDKDGIQGGKFYTKAKNASLFHKRPEEKNRMIKAM